MKAVFLFGVWVFPGGGKVLFMGWKQRVGGKVRSKDSLPEMLADGVEECRVRVN